MIRNIFEQTTDKQRMSIMGGVRAAQEQLARLDARPVKLSDREGPAPRREGGHDGMLGTLMLDGMLGGFFSMAAADAVPHWATQVDIGTAADLADEYWMDRRRAARFELGKGGDLAQAWNVPVPEFLPERAKLEGHIVRAHREMPRVISLAA